MSTPAISVRALTKTYRTGHTALAGLDLDIEAGETFALLGPNGAGKSTAVEILEGYRHRTSGEARVLGVDPARGGASWKARVGIVLQDTGEAPPASVHELLTIVARSYPRPRDVDEVIDAVGLASKARASVRSLSGGQRRRVDVALGIVGRPEVLFLDEPTTGFDPEARQVFWGLVRSLQADGTTIVLTTHDLHEAAALAGRAGVLVGGALAFAGPIDELGGPGARVPIVRWREGGVERAERTDRPGEAVAALAGRLGEPERLEVVRPTLEDCYLDLLRERRAAPAADDGETRDESPGDDAAGVAA